MSIHSSDIKRHIINKKYLWSYSIIISISFGYGYLIYINKIMTSFWDDLSFRVIFPILIVLGLPILSMCCILTNSYRCQKFYKFYKDCLKEYNLHFHKIMVEREAFKVGGTYSFNDATIHPYSKSINAVSLETDNYLLLFFSVSFWGMFQEVLNPFIFVKPGKEFHAKYKNANIIQEFKMSQTEQNIVINFPANRSEIKKVIIPRLD